MARITIHHCVRSYQGKTVLMLVDVVHRNCPAVGRVTQVALSAVFPPVDVSMTVLTLLTGVRENWVNVTLLASDFRVHSAQRKWSLRMIELRLRPQREPPLAGVAVSTRNLYVSVRTFVGVRHAGRSSLGRRD
jgi:hypothetical protein